MNTKALTYAGSIASIGVVALLAHFAPALFTFFEHSAEHSLITTFFLVACIFALSFTVFYISHITTLPSFVIALLFGIAAHPLLAPIVEEHEVLGALVGFGATLILFSGGLETPFTNFKKIFWKIFSLAFPGLLVTAFLFSLSVYAISRWFGLEISIIAAVLLGSVLASTDPAAIIPVLKRLRFFNRSTKDIVISESAVTDVTGTLLTVAFLALITAGTHFSSITDWYKTIFTAASGLILLKQLFFGIIFGVLGYGLLELLQRFKRKHEREFEADSALFIFVPVIIFTFALSFGGSGYLAAFIAGLLFNLTEHLHETERFFNHVVDGFFKPTIFILLGALVNIRELFAYAGVGIVVALVFMFIIRPLTVFLSLILFTKIGKERLGWREMAFISFVRETGAIPAVLLVTITSLKLVGMEGLVPVGMWVILLTLIIEPILTPWVAKRLKVAEIIEDTSAKTAYSGTSAVLLGTRGRSFITRLPIVADWAVKHGIEKVTVLLCLEDNHTLELAHQIAEEAKAEFAKTAIALNAQTKAAPEFSFESRTGFLQENIKQLASEDTNISAIFVGRKMLDFRLKEIQNLGAPLYFME